MKLTKSQLKQIIKEELESAIEEASWRALPNEPEVTGIAAGEREATAYKIIFQTPVRTEADIWDPGKKKHGIPRWSRGPASPTIYWPDAIPPSGLAVEGPYDEDEMRREIDAIKDLKKVDGTNFIAAYEVNTDPLKIVEVGDLSAVNAVLENPTFNSPGKSALAMATGTASWPQEYRPGASPLGGDTEPLQRIAERERMLKQIIKEELVQVLRESQRAA